MGYFKRLAAKTENAAVGFVQVPNTDQYVVASREPMSGGELVGVVDIKGNWVSHASRAYTSTTDGKTEKIACYVKDLPDLSEA